jgi:DNA processing protein
MPGGPLAPEQRALIDLAHCVEPGDAAIGALVEATGPDAVTRRIRAGRIGPRQVEGLRARLDGTNADVAVREAARVGARIVTRVDSEWPSQLGDLGDQAPFALWVVGAGDLRLLALRSVAMVGARACTPYGQETAREWAAELASDGWCVVSGGAFGIDAAAHRGALAAGGPTICVLAGGVDVPYPRAHDALIARIADEGLVVSESPPGESVRRQRFLSRNRVIAAMCRATVRSGTTATARAAGLMGRPVLAVPGPVTSPASAGCHRMIREGEARLVAQVEDVVEHLGLAGGRAVSVLPAGVAQDRDRLDLRERVVLDAMPGRGAVTVDRLVRAAGLGGTDILAALGILEATGWVGATPDGWRLARR